MKRRGFTLVELLIVIVVIGILSSMMMLSSNEAVSSAKATRIISDLKNLQTAVIAWYADNSDKIEADGRVKYKNEKKPIQEHLYEQKDLRKEILKYLNNSAAISLNEEKGTNVPAKKGGYAVCDAGGTNRTTWFVGYVFADGESNLRSKLIPKMNDLGLQFSNGNPTTNPDTKIDLSKAGSAVWMGVFGKVKAKTSSN